MWRGDSYPVVVGPKRREGDEKESFKHTTKGRRDGSREKWNFKTILRIIWIKNTVFILALNLTCHCYVQITGEEKTSTLSHCSKYSRNIYRYYTKSDFKILYITLKKKKLSSAQITTPLHFQMFGIVIKNIIIKDVN